MSTQANQTETLAAADSLTWQYNYPLQVPQNYSAVCPQTTQADSTLQVQNLSTSNALTFFVNGGGLHESHTIAANTPQPWVTQQNFGGAELKISNLSSRPATAQVTLTST